MISDKFLVIEGLDGAGKSTQVKLLEEYLNQKGVKCKFLHFPRYEAPIYGDLIAKFLRGDLGDINSVNPYVVALLYGLDRASASKDIEQWIEQGYYVIADRYVYSNIAYQCAKTNDKNVQKELREWILNFEYNHNKIIKPANSIFLDVPFCFTEKSLTTQRSGDERDYLNGKQDIHEASLLFQKKVREVYIAQEELDNSFHVIGCSNKDGGMLPPSEIFSKILNLIE